MSEVWIRSVVLATIVALVVWAIWRRHRVATARPEPAERPDLGAGVHLFASTTCRTCEAARRVLADVYNGQFNEIVYEDDPARFGAAGIRAVPTVFVLGPDGRGQRFEGVPRRSDLPTMLGPATIGL